MGSLTSAAFDRLEEKKLQQSHPGMTKEEIEKSPVGVRFSEGKPRWSLVHFKSLEPMVRVLEFGAKKYDDNNWKKGLNKKQILESMQRHLAELIDGTTHDNESKLHHIGHIMCNAMFYSFFDLPENAHLETKK